MARTRNYAIDSVLIYEFRYEPGGNRFVIVPHEPVEILSEQTNIDPQGQVSLGSSADQLVRVGGTLRAGVQFAVAVNDDAENLGIPVITPPPVPLADWQIQGLPNADELSGVAWSEPMLFYPDGSAQQSILRLEDEYGQSVEISVRGLTGVVSAQRIREENGIMKRLPLIANQTRTSQGRTGLTLLEVVLSIAIFVMSMAVLSELVATGHKASLDSKLQTQAIIRAEAQMNEIIANPSLMVSTSGMPFAEEYTNAPGQWNWSLTVAILGAKLESAAT